MTAAPIFVDTDVGVDDAAAIAWLLRAAPVVGFTTVFGNTTVEHATRNLLTLLDAVGCSLPVTVGAAGPLAGERPRSAALIHGPDGFWGTQQSYDISSLPCDAPAAIAAAARANPGMTLIALGPLTNVAAALERFPDELAAVRMVVLAGAWRGGNTTPVAEFNAFADPLALDQVLRSGARVDLVTLDAFDQVVVEPEPFLARLEEQGGAVGGLLARMLRPYFRELDEFDTGVYSLPDVAAAVYALHPELGTAVPGLVRVVTQRGYAFGQTIIGTGAYDRLRLLVDDEELNGLLDAAEAEGRDLASVVREVQQREADNAIVVHGVDGPRMVELLTATLCA